MQRIATLWMNSPPDRITDELLADTRVVFFHFLYHGPFASVQDPLRRFCAALTASCRPCRDPVALVQLAVLDLTRRKHAPARIASLLNIPLPRVRELIAANAELRAQCDRENGSALEECELLPRARHFNRTADGD